MAKPYRRIAVVVAAALTLSAAPAGGPGAPRASDDPGLAAVAVQLESFMDDHLWFGQVTSTTFGSESQAPGDVINVHQVSDSALWTGVYLAGQAARFEVALATGDRDEEAAALARIREIADGQHRNITISKYWTPASECSLDNPPTSPTVTTKPSLEGPSESCGVTADGVTTGEPGRLFRACFPAGFPFQAQDPATRPPMIFGPIPWEDGQDWYCEDGTSRDQYAGATFGLTAAMDAIAGQPGLEDLTRQIADDLMAMTGYLVRHGWSVVYPHTRVHTGGSENFVFPLFVQVPTARLNMAITARHAAYTAGTIDQQAFFEAVWQEEWAHFGHAQVGENLLAIQSPHNSYYVMNLQHLTSWDVMRYAPDAATRQAEKAYFAIIDETTRDDVNAWFETLTFGMTGDRWRHDLALANLQQWVTYRERNDDGIARSTPDRCGTDFDCAPKDEVNWYLDTPSGQQKATQPGTSSEMRGMTPLPVADRVSHHDFLWQRSPYELRSSQPADPQNREPGVDFLTPYWMLRYFEQAAPPTVTGMPDWAGPHTEARSADWSGPNDTIGPRPTPGEDGRIHLVGALHEHSGYSDGWFDTRPEDYYRSGKGYGLDFMGGGDHSDTLNVPLSVSEGCLEGDIVPGQNLIPCALGDPDQPTDGFTKWDATKRQAAEVSDPDYSAFQGFEWTNDRFGHMNVYFSQNQTGAKNDGGYADMTTFWEWFTRHPDQGGGADGIATFNHPSDKKIDEIDGEETQNWNDFAYVAAADDRLVGIEVFNQDDEFGVRTNSLATAGFYARALDRGWHVGAIGAEDLGHQYDDAYGDDDNNWGGPAWAKTVVVADDNTPAAIRAAMLARSFYAVNMHENDLRIHLSVDGAPMGSRVTRQVGSAVVIEAGVNDTGLTLELVTNGGQILATSTGTALALAAPVTDGESWYHLRVRRDGDPVAYSSPVWVNATSAAVRGEWLSGDLHVHTCYSHDGYCGPDDDGSETLEYEVNPDHPEDTSLNSDVYTLSGDIDERFMEASVRGLDYVAITDHNDVRSSADPDFGSHGVIGVAGYEKSLSGHAQMLGARHIYDRGDGVAGIQAMADTLRANGGVFQINHPADGLATSLEGCEPSDFAELDWGMGMQVVPDTVEVWNIGHVLQPPAPAGNSNDDAERFWECFLDTGHHVGATGGSDSHWLSTSAFQGVGNPTTWILAEERSERGILEAIRAGRTSISALPPVAGGAPLLLEADTDGDGIFEAAIGDTVPPGTTMRVRSASPAATGTVVVRAKGQTIVEGAMLAGGSITFTGPEAGWVRAKLVSLSMPDDTAPLCDPLDGTPLDSSYCHNQVHVAGLTSPIYVDAVPTILTVAAPLSVHTTDTAQVCAWLTAVDGSVADRELTLELGSQSDVVRTATDGSACADLLVDVDPGLVTVKASFSGDGRYGASTGTTTTNVTAEPTVLSFPSATWHGNTVSVTVSLREHDDVPIAGQSVTVTAGKSSVAVITDTDGLATAEIRGPVSGSQATVTATFSGTVRLEPATTSVTLDRAH